MGGDAWRARNERLRVVGVRGGAYVLLLVSVAGNNENEEVSMGEWEDEDQEEEEGKALSLGGIGCTG